MKHRRPKFRLKFRPKEDRREEYEPEKVVFFLENATLWDVVVGAIQGVGCLLIGAVVVCALVLLVLLLPLLF